MAKITLNTITNGQNISAINQNFSEIADALNEGTFWRDNPVGEANALLGDVDFNSNDAFNINALAAKSITINGVAVEPTEVTVANSLKIANNLSDLQSIAAAKFNLGLNNVENTSDAAKPVSVATSNALALKLDTSAANAYITKTGVNAMTGAYDFTGASAFAIPTVGVISNSTTGASTAWTRLLFASPPALGNTAPNAVSATTLSASSTVSGTGFSNYLASPPAIGGTAPAAGSFTSLASTNVKVLANNTSGQSIPNNTPTVVTGYTVVSQVGSSFVASTGVFTAPATGWYDVSAQAYFGAAMATANVIGIQILVAGTAVAQGTAPVLSTTSGTNVVQVNAKVPVTAGQTITIAVIQNNGAAVALNTAALTNRLSIAQIP